MVTEVTLQLRSSTLSQDLDLKHCPENFWTPEMTLHWSHTAREKQLWGNADMGPLMIWLQGGTPQVQLTGKCCCLQNPADKFA